MNLSEQVCSLELAKRLKELGVKQKSYAFWIEFRNESSPKEQWPNVYNDLIRSGERSHYKERSYLKDLKFYSAFSVAELGNLLPKYIIQENIEFYFTQLPSKHLDKWIIFYRNTFNSWDHQDQEDLSEANARAKMLIYLIENNLITL